MKIGIIQICSQLDYKENLVKIRSYLDKAKELGVEAVFLPECFYSMSDGINTTPFLIESKNEHYLNVQRLATDYSISILGGSAATKEKNSKIINRNYNFDKLGNDLGHYDKIHLFSCDIKSKDGNKTIDESDIYTPGTTPKIIKETNLGLTIGLSICFDVRYPQMYQEYRAKGANLLTIASAFTVPTGKAHWHLLVRARAIENQCFVVAPAQWGNNNDRIKTFGHSLIIDPWGEVLADAAEGEKLITAEIDLTRIEEVKSAVKM